MQNARQTDMRLDRTIALVVLAVATIVALAFQGTRGLYETTESRYAECAREMLETGNWLVPQLDYQPHWTKPPLSYWTMAGGMALLGVNEWGARLPGAVAFVVTVWVIMQLGAVLWDRSTGWLAGLIYATAPFAVGAANTVNTDTLLTLWMLGEVFVYWKARQRVYENKSAAGPVLLLWFFAGLGFLTKGPPSLLIFLVIVTSHLIDRRQGRPVPQLFSYWGMLVFLAVGFGWYVWAAATPPGLLGYWLGDEFFGRISTDEFGRNTEWYKPLVIYPPPLALGLGLWAVVAGKAAYRQFQNVRQLGIGASLRERPVLRFFAVWIGLPLVVFSFSHSRLPLYVLPLLPAVALVLARSLTASYSSLRLRRIVAIVGVLSAVLAIGGKAAVAYLPSSKDERAFHQVIRQWGEADAAIVNCTYRDLHGLQFYFHGRVERLDLPGTEEELIADVRQLAQRIATRPPGCSYVIVTRVEDHRISEALDQLAIDYTRTVIRQGAVIVVGPGPEATLPDKPG